ncbi:anti-sigma factor family protein [Melghirimyces algeriensis]|uniref:Anti-sigma-W factor RsiW n=1 Tax=Melghirimyces algeriensis TaxID=910412 RepID=A0A521CKW6_9BACL|nr:zf-HC2 domain-containing protein [Melghirimyces algeriensis]SMO60068.1 Putative zinc-finger [Melghirimyces algeriensis]
MSSSCKDMDHLIQLYVDQEIEMDDRQRLKEHVETCSSCRKNLLEMLDLVQSLEEIRNHQENRSKPITLLNYGVKWVAVYVAIIFLVAFVPGVLQHRSTEGNELANDSVPSNPSHYEMMVLATQAEKLHIPESDYVHVTTPQSLTADADIETALIYPSALPFFEKKMQDWNREAIKRFVFVRIPDNKTLQTILSLAGSDVKKTSLEKPSFPMSIILTTGEKPSMEIFSFPEKKKNISHWFDKMATTSVIH